MGRTWQQMKYFPNQENVQYLLQMFTDIESQVEKVI